MAANQIYWQKADWQKLENYVANRAAYIVKHPEKLVIDHTYFEDIRKITWLLEHIHAGRYNASVYAWDQVTFPSIQFPNVVEYYAGEWTVTTQVNVHGVDRWLYWKNKRDLWNSDINNSLDPPFMGPPIDIHPSENVWILSNAEWELAPSPNYYYDWSEVFAGKAHINLGVLKDSDGFEVQRNIMSVPPAAFYPGQTDAKEHLRPIIYTDTEQKGFQYKAKVPFDAEIITVPEQLGARLAIWSRMKYRKFGVTEVIERRDAFGLKYHGGFDGNQYCNYGGWEYNTHRTGKYFAYEQGLNVEWSFNPKVNRALQNKVEVVLSSDQFRLPADETFKENFGVFYDCAGQEDQNNHWDEYPGVNNELWGENESGFELFLKKSGSYDWYFDTAYKYIPFNIAEEAMWVVKSDTYEPSQPAMSTVQSQWDLNHQGNWRRTYKNSLGRPSAFMRSFEMGTPANRRDAWSPDTPPTYSRGDYDNAAFWFGSRTNAMPTLEQFDDVFYSITKTSNYSFTINGDLTDLLQAGWMIHLCTERDNTIDNVLPAYALSVVYDINSDTTKIVCSEMVGNYTKAGWNRQISLRHDGIGAEWQLAGDEMTYTISYYPTGELLLEVKNLLNLAIYHAVNLTFESRHFNAGTSYDLFTEAALDECSQLSSDRMQTILSAYTDDDIENENSSGDSESDETYSERWYWVWYTPYFDTGWYKINAENFGEQGICVTEQYNDFSTYNRQIQGFAVKFTWEEQFSELPQIVNIRVRVAEESINWDHYIGVGQAGDYPGLDEAPFDFILPQTVKLGGITLENWLTETDEESERRSRYTTMPMAIDNEWHTSFPDDHDMSVSYVDPYEEFEQLPFNYEMVIGEGSIPLKITTEESTPTAFVTLDWESTLASVWERCFANHIDAPRVLAADDKPPHPSPPVFHTSPQAYFVFKPAVDDNPEYFELRVSGASCLCEDHEGSDPVKYKILCRENPGLDSDWSESRDVDLFIKEIAIPTYTPTGTTSNPSGSITRITCPGNHVIGDMIKITGTDHNNGRHLIVNVGSGYFEINKGWYLVETFGVAARVANITRIYDMTDWENDAVSDYTFALQAKDSAADVQGTQDNLTKIGRYESVATPTQWPPDIYP